MVDQNFLDVSSEGLDTIGTRILHLRTLFKLSQADFGRLIAPKPMKQGTVSNWERGVTIPQPVSLRRIVSIIDDGDQLLPWLRDDGETPQISVYRDLDGKWRGRVTTGDKPLDCALAQDKSSLRELVAKLLAKAAQERASADIIDLINKFTRQLDATENGCLFRKKNA